MWSDLLKRGRKMVDQPGATEDDVLPIRCKELFIKCVRGDAEILFEGCVPVTPVFRPAVDQDAIHVYHQCFDRQGADRLRH
jgi:hypothetical protein